MESNQQLNQMPNESSLLWLRYSRTILRHLQGKLDWLGHTSEGFSAESTCSFASCTKEGKHEHQFSKLYAKQINRTQKYKQPVWMKGQRTQMQQEDKGPLEFSCLDTGTQAKATWFPRQFPRHSSDGPHSGSSTWKTLYGLGRGYDSQRVLTPAGQFVWVFFPTFQAGWLVVNTVLSSVNSTTG